MLNATTISTRYRAELLGLSDSARLAAFYGEPLRSNGAVSVKLDRSPDFWEALQVEGRHSDVLAVFDLEQNLIAGAMICSQKTVFNHGEKINMGYVSSLKVAAEYQGSIVWQVLFNFFREYSRLGKPFVWLFSVFTNNRRAIHFFTKKDRSLPIFLPLEESVTYVFTKRELPATAKGCRNITIQFASQSDVEDIIGFIREEAQERSFLPDYSQNELVEGKGLLSGFCLNDLLIAKDQDRICGIMGLWDQSKLRRWRVENYSKFLRIARPLINTSSLLTRMPTLPPEGKCVPYKVICLMLVKNNDVEIRKQLFNSLMRSRDNRKQVYSISLLKSDPLGRYFKRRTVKFNNKIYIGYLPENESLVRTLNLKNLYIEQGAL